MPGPRKGSGSRSEEQWTVVEKSQENGNDLAHHWRLVTVRSQHGTFRPGLQCVDCAEIKVLTQRQIDSRFGRGVDGWK